MVALRHKGRWKMVHCAQLNWDSVTKNGVMNIERSIAISNGIYNNDFKLNLQAMLYTHGILTGKNSKTKNISEEITYLLVDVLCVRAGKK